MSAELITRLVLIVIGVGLAVWVAYHGHRDVGGGIIRLALGLLALALLALGLGLLPLPGALDAALHGAGGGS